MKLELHFTKTFLAAFVVLSEMIYIHKTCILKAIGRGQTIRQRLGRVDRNETVYVPFNGEAAEFYALSHRVTALCAG